MPTKANYDFKDLPEWITLLRSDLNLKGMGLGLARVPAGSGYTFMHRHEKQEEVYIVLSGEGIIHVDGQDISLTKGDFVRVSPEENRALKAGDNADLVCLIVGALPVKGYPRKPASQSLIDDGLPDWDSLPPWYEGNEKVMALNQKMKAKRGNKT